MATTWSTPRDWTTNEVVTSTLLNAHLRDNLNAVTRAGGATGLTPTTSSADITSSTDELSWRTAATAGNTTGWLIPAGLIGTDRMLRLIMHGDALINTSGNLRMRIYLRDGVGGNTLLFDDTPGNSTGANRQPWGMEVNVAALGSASSQIMWGHLWSLRPGVGAPASGIGQFEHAQADNPDHYGRFADDAASAVDMSAATYLDVTGTWSSSSASLSWRLKYATLVVL